MSHDVILSAHRTRSASGVALNASCTVDSGDQQLLQAKASEILFCADTVTAVNLSESNMAQAPDARSQTFVDAFWPLQKLLDNNAISPSAYKAICAVLEHELDNGQMQSEQEVISIIQNRAQAQVPPTGISNTPPPSAQGQAGNGSGNNMKSRGIGDDDQSRG